MGIGRIAIGIAVFVTGAGFAQVGAVPVDQNGSVTTGYSQSAKTAPLQPASSKLVLTQLVCTPTNLVSGGLSSCSVMLSLAAPAGGVPLSLSSDNGLVTLPQRVLVSAGSTTAKFTATVGTVTYGQTANITAKYRQLTRVAALTLLAPVSISLAPATATLSGGQSQQFNATVTGGAGNTSVAWSLSPDVGTISATGLYTAPEIISAQLTITVKATSAADSTKSAAATLTLLAPVSISLSPATASLSAGQAQQFTATVTGGSGNPAVTWSLSPYIGFISSSGLYTAPESVTSQQTVTVKATSVADSSKCATAVVTLRPSETVVLSPTASTLHYSQTVQFTAGTSERPVTWSLDPVVGSITTSGLYTAPSHIGITQTVIVTATSIADPAKYASSTITLAPVAALSWTASDSPNVAGYNIYRSTASGGPYTRVNPSLVPGLGYEDVTVTKTRFYHYVATAANDTGDESPYSVECMVLIE